jgi:uncharacterized membrane protein
MKKTLLLSLVLLIILTISASADNINTLVEVYPDGTAEITQNLVINSLNINKGFYFPAISPENIEITDSNGKVKFAVINDSFLIQPKKRLSTYNLKINYLTNGLTKKDKKVWELNYFTTHSTPIIFSFPESTKLIESSANSVIYSEDDQMKLGWKLAKDSSVKIIYENEFKPLPPNISKIALYVLSTIILLILLVYCFKRGYCKLTKRLSPEKKDLLKTLDQKENEVVNLLINNKNQAYQSMIQKETGISKATLSRTIKRLEDKNLIEVRQTGNTNLIILSEWFIKK